MHKPKNIFAFELIGTAVILFGAALGTVFAPSGSINWITPPFVGLAIALTFHKSGAHLNPAVTGLVNALSRIRRASNFAYLTTQFATALAAGLLLREALRLQNATLIYLVEVQGDQVATVLSESAATFLLMSLIAVMALNGIAIWTIVAVPALLFILQLGPLAANQMNPAVTVAQTIEGLLTVSQLAEHLLGELIGLALVTLWVKLWLTRKRPTRAN
jgi:glycerol uptake facilitator-like aquaporin